jgi:predicted AAA+ superfamily ATPase
VFELLCSYPAAEISLRKLVGQLQDPGTIETVKHYIELLEGAFLIKTLPKFTTNPIQKRSSSPKILPLAPALCTFARAEVTLTDSLRGRLFELAVGLDLARLPGELSYWRVDNDEVDYVYRLGRHIIAIEVKSGRHRSPHGLVAFKRAFPSARTVTIAPEQYDLFCRDVRGFILGE